VSEPSIGVVLRIDAKTCHVEVGGARHVLPLRGRLFEHGGDRQLVAVGDRVRIRLDGEGSAIEEVLPRTTQLVRSRGDGETQIIAANVSLVVVTAALTDPPFLGELVDRILAGATREKLDTALVLTKVDRDRKGLAPVLAERYGQLGYRVFVTSIAPDAETTDALRELRALLQRNTSVLSGASGVGKSSLINALCPGLELRIGTMSRIRQGRHTTTHTQLVPLPGGGHLLDTPGIRGFGLGAADPQEIQFLFPEIRALVGRCEYRNCTHMVEPGCAVEAELQRGALVRERIASYRAIMEELTAR
jgi:ribosome biogenesis GTPase